MYSINGPVSMVEVVSAALEDIVLDSTPGGIGGHFKSIIPRQVFQPS